MGFEDSTETCVVRLLKVLQGTPDSLDKAVIAPIIHNLAPFSPKAKTLRRGASMLGVSVARVTQGNSKGSFREKDARMAQT